MLTKDRAICIRTVDYSETSQIVTFFTRANGKVSVIAKGSKRPKSAFGGPIEILSFGKIVFSDSTKEKLATLTEFEPAPVSSVEDRNGAFPAFTHLSRNSTGRLPALFAFNCCLFAAELVNNLTQPYDPHPELFDSFLRFLQDVNEHRVSSIEHQQILSLLILFQLALLKEVGLMPILNACANCKTQYAIHNTQYELYFSSSANGLICRDCQVSFPDKIGLTISAADCLSNLKQIAESDEKTLSEIEKVLIYHFTELLGRPPKMAKHILKM